MNKYLPGDSFFVILDEELLVCEILDFFSKSKVRVRITRDAYIDTVEKYVPCQIVDKDYLDEICIGYEDLFHYLNVDLVDT